MERIPFDIKEIENATMVPSRFGTETKRYDYPISPKENYRLIYERKVPFWLPGFNDTATLTPRIDPDNMARAFAFEANAITPEEMVGGPDKFGIPWVYVPQAGGSMVEPGNPTLTDTNDWPDVIQFPDVASWDWAGTAEANKDYAGDKWLVYSHLTGLFERLISFMDFENAAVALLDPDQKPATLSLLDALADNIIDIAGRAYDAYGMDAYNMHDDWGAQRAPFFSLETCMEMIVPSLTKIANFIHNELGIFFDIHSCGLNEILVPAYIAAGCDSWGGQDINDKAKLHAMYGDKLLMSVTPNLGIDPFNPGEVDIDKAMAITKEYVETYIPGYKEKPLTAGFFAAPPGVDDYFYQACREGLNAIA